MGSQFQFSSGSLRKPTTQFLFQTQFQNSDLILVKILLCSSWCFTKPQGSCKTRTKQLHGARARNIRNNKKQKELCKEGLLPWLRRDFDAIHACGLFGRARTSTNTIPDCCIRCCWMLPHASRPRSLEGFARGWL